MKIFSAIINLLKKERVCVIPELNFDNKRVKRVQREAIKYSENEKIENDFANAYLERVRGILLIERNARSLKRKNIEFSRRPLKNDKNDKNEIFLDELDVMISNLSSLNGLNVVERVYLNKKC